MSSAKDDVWHHVVVNLGEEELSTYIDGVLTSKTSGYERLLR